MCISVLPINRASKSSRLFLQDVRRAVKLHTGNNGRRMTKHS